MTEIPPKKNGGKPTAATCALTLDPGHSGTELAPLELGTYYIRPKRLHTDAPKNAQDRPHFWTRYSFL